MYKIDVADIIFLCRTNSEFINFPYHFCVTTNVIDSEWNTITTLQAVRIQTTESESYLFENYRNLN